MEEWRYLPFDNYDAYENMAIDEAILRENQREKLPPTLRFYGWRTPTVSLGYFQNIGDEVDVDFCRGEDIQVVRRPTGGKAVLHKNDLTYAVIARDNNPLFPPGLLGTYRIISECIAAGLARVGIEAHLSRDGRVPDIEGLGAYCFSIPSQYELLVKGRKICGSAQMRSKGVFLQHGSILMEFNSSLTCQAIGKSGGPLSGRIARLKKQVTSVYENIDTSPDCVELSNILASEFEKCLGIRLVKGELTPREEVLKERLLYNKYRTSSWNGEGKSRE